MTERSHEELKSLIAPYALGAVTTDEIPAIRAHILSCDECMGEADRLAAVSASLALAAEPTAVPPGFAEAVLTKARAQEPARTEERSKRRRWQLAPVAVAAGLLLGIAGVGVALEARRDVTQQQEVLTALLHGKGLDLRGPSGAVAKVVPKGQGALLAVAGLQRAPDGHTYQLWLIEDGDPISGGIFDIEDGLALLEVDRDLGGVDAAAVTIEPGDGVDEPTGDPIISST